MRFAATPETAKASLAHVPSGRESSAARAVTWLGQ